jgi:hypothetical protein
MMSYRGLKKNATRAFTALALANTYLSRERLMAQVRPKGRNAHERALRTGPRGHKIGRLTLHFQEINCHQPRLAF